MPHDDSLGELDDDLAFDDENEDDPDDLDVDEEDSLDDDEDDDEDEDDPDDDAEPDDQDDENDDLDGEFPRGDGTADTAATVYCPHCGEPVDVTLDPGGGGTQDYVEDCEVCCQPWRVSVRYDAAGGADVQVTALDE